MNRKLNILNFLGIVALAVLCGFQWKKTRDLHTHSVSQEIAIRDLEKRLADREQALKLTQTDLEEFRQKLISTHESLKKEETLTQKLRSNVEQLDLEREELKNAVTKWAEAVRVRDDRLKELSEKLNTLAEERNATVAKYNELATKHNETVELLNERTKQFNTLVEQAKAEKK